VSIDGVGVSGGTATSDRPTASALPAVGATAGRLRSTESGRSGAGVSLDDPPQATRVHDSSNPGNTATLATRRQCMVSQLAFRPPGRKATDDMIGRLLGEVVDEQPDGTVTLNVQGVGYEVLTPVGALGRAQRPGGLTELWVHTVMRENALELFGFATELDRRVFRVLIGVHGVGPRTGVGILSSLPTDELLASVAASDVPRLVRVPGIGKKTAERLILELQGKLPAPTGSGTSAPPDRSQLLTSALINLGYRAADAERVVKTLSEELASQPLASLVREALARLGKGHPPNAGGS
jgi:Holliday junction DNA helicase RuvA